MVQRCWFPITQALPIDGMILHTVVYDEIGRHVRMLGRT